jgi:hypothetical protein
MAIEKITPFIPVRPSVEQQKFHSNESHNNTSKNAHEDAFLDVVFAAPVKKQKWGLFTPLLIIMLAAGALLLFL